MGVMRGKYSFVLGLLLLIALDISDGCSPHGARRRKRSTPTAPEVASKLSEFFGSCSNLIRSSRGAFDSLQSVVDYVIRDSNWYNNIKSTVCTDSRDNPSCWIYALNFLIDDESDLYKATAQCICKWSGDCFDGSSSNPVKREVRNDGYGSYGSKSRLPRCIETKSRKYVSQYPSLRKVDGQSIITFLEDHYTFCRYTPEFPYEQRNLFQLLYSERLCPRSGSWRDSFPDLFTKATRQDGPIWAAYQQCLDKCTPNPCQNGGKCKTTDADPGYKCFCRNGYGGKLCEKRDCVDKSPYMCQNLYGPQDCRYGFVSLYCKRTCRTC